MLCRDRNKSKDVEAKTSTMMTPRITTCKETNKKKRRLEGRENKRKNTRNLTRPRSDEVVYGGGGRLKGYGGDRRRGDCCKGHLRAALED